MRLLLRGLAVTVVLALTLCLLAPWLAYEIALARLPALPARPQALATAQQQDEVWRKAGGEGPLVLEPLNPYGFVVALVTRDRVRPGEELAYWVARDHLTARRAGGSMLGWQVSNAALTIWLTRHWSREELASAAHAAVARSGQRP